MALKSICEVGLSFSVFSGWVWPEMKKSLEMFSPEMVGHGWVSRRQRGEGEEEKKTGEEALGVREKKKNKKKRKRNKPEEEACVRGEEEEEEEEEEKKKKTKSGIREKLDVLCSF